MCAALTQGRGRMKDEGVPRVLEGGKGLWPHEGWGGDVERMSRHMGYGMGESPENVVGGSRRNGG